LQILPIDVGKYYICGFLFFQYMGYFEDTFKEIKMATFVLKKYEEKKNDTGDSKPAEKTGEQEPEVDEKLVITVTGTVAEIVANALNKTLSNKVEVIESEDPALSDIKAVSTEDINSDPANTFNSIKTNDAVFIHNTGFKTAKEEWFLMNLPNKNSNVFYTLESFIAYIKVKLNIKD